MLAGTPHKAGSSCLHSPSPTPGEPPEKSLGLKAAFLSRRGWGRVALAISNFWASTEKVFSSPQAIHLQLPGKPGAAWSRARLTSQEPAESVEVPSVPSPPARSLTTPPTLVSMSAKQCSQLCLPCRETEGSSSPSKWKRPLFSSHVYQVCECACSQEWC